MLFKTLFTKGVKIYNYVIYYIMPWLIPKILTLRQYRLLLKASGKHSEHKTHKSLSDIFKHILKFWLLLRALACIVQTSALHQAPCFKLLHHIYPTQARDAQNVTQHCVYAKSLVHLTAGIQYFAIWINFLKDRKINISQIKQTLHFQVPTTNLKINIQTRHSPIFKGEQNNFILLHNHLKNSWLYRFKSQLVKLFTDFHLAYKFLNNGNSKIEVMAKL